MNFVLRTAHAEEKKEKGSHKPRRTYDNNNNILKIADVPSMWGSLRSPNNYYEQLPQAMKEV